MHWQNIESQDWGGLSCIYLYYLVLFIYSFYPRQTCQHTSPLFRCYNFAVTINCRMKKVLIIPSNTDLNRGDQALIWESAHLAESLFKVFSSILFAILFFNGPIELGNKTTGFL